MLGSVFTAIIAVVVVVGTTTAAATTTAVSAVFTAVMVMNVFPGRGSAGRGFLGLDGVHVDVCGVRARRPACPR